MQTLPTATGIADPPPEMQVDARDIGAVDRER